MSFCKLLQGKAATAAVNALLPPMAAAAANALLLPPLATGEEPPYPCLRALDPRPAYTLVHEGVAHSVVFRQLCDLANGNGAALVTQCEPTHGRQVCEGLNAHRLLCCNAADSHGP